MIAAAIRIAAILAIAILGGAASVSLALDSYARGEAGRSGQWVALPHAPGADANPYALALAGRSPSLPLARAEGTVYVANADSRGIALRRDCSYTISGTVPSARFWTLHAGGSGELVPSAGLHSQAVLRGDDDSLVIDVAPHAAPGNWLRLTGEGPLTLVLSLFDTPVSGGAEAADLPGIERQSCDGQ